MSANNIYFRETTGLSATAGQTVFSDPFDLTNCRRLAWQVKSITATGGTIKLQWNNGLGWEDVPATTGWLLTVTIANPVTKVLYIQDFPACLCRLSIAPTGADAVVTWIAIGKEY